MAATEMTCADAREAALSVSENNELYNNGEEIAVQGYVTAIQTVWSSQFKNITFWMADTKDGGKVLEAYRCVAEVEADAPAVGDLVKVTGNLTKYNTTPEFAAGCTFEMIEKGEPVVIEVTEVTVAGALAAAANLADGSQTDEIFGVTGVVIAMINDKDNTYEDGGWAKFGNQTFWIGDTGSEEAAAATAFEVYRGVPAEEVKVGDKIRVESAIKNYKGTIESLQGAKVTILARQGIEGINLTEKAQKVMVDGVVYVVRDNKMFDLLGNQVR